MSDVIALPPPSAPAWELGSSYLCACPFCGGFHWHGAPPGEQLSPTRRCRRRRRPAAAANVVAPTARPDAKEPVAQQAKMRDLCDAISWEYLFQRYHVKIWGWPDNLDSRVAFVRHDLERQAREAYLQGKTLVVPRSIDGNLNTATLEQVTVFKLVTAPEPPAPRGRRRVSEDDAGTGSQPAPPAPPAQPPGAPSQHATIDDSQVERRRPPEIVDPLQQPVIRRRRRAAIEPVQPPAALEPAQPPAPPVPPAQPPLPPPRPAALRIVRPDDPPPHRPAALRFVRPDDPPPTAASGVFDSIAPFIRRRRRRPEPPPDQAG
jgi:hypothetical protein